MGPDGLTEQTKRIQNHLNMTPEPFKCVCDQNINRVWTGREFGCSGVDGDQDEALTGLV